LTWFLTRPPADPVIGEWELLPAEGTPKIVRFDPNGSVVFSHGTGRIHGTWKTLAPGRIDMEIKDPAWRKSPRGTVAHVAFPDPDHMTFFTEAAPEPTSLRRVRR
jgi:hypothetical protein